MDLHVCPVTACAHIGQRQYVMCGHEAHLWQKRASKNWQVAPFHHPRLPFLCIQDLPHLMLLLTLSHHSHLALDTVGHVVALEPC